MKDHEKARKEVIATLDLWRSQSLLKSGKPAVTTEEVVDRLLALTLDTAQAYAQAQDRLDYVRKLRDQYVGQIMGGFAASESFRTDDEAARAAKKWADAAIRDLGYEVPTL